jgi:hypothetical protein
MLLDTHALVWAMSAPAELSLARGLAVVSKDATLDATGALGWRRVW